MLAVKTDDAGVTFSVRVSPRASRSAILGVHDAALKVSLAAPPVDGEANAELIALLAKSLHVPKRAVRILQGERGKSKVVHVTGVSAEAVQALVMPHE
jgi:uncharacterized protein (TIGR00251 family)